MANIPNDINGEILLKLPVYSLLRLRWVCKYWFNLITRDPDFVKMHLFHSTSDHDELINKTLVLIYDGKVLYSSKYKDIFDTSSLKPAFMICKKNPFGCKFKTLGSCNGLIYLRTFSSTYKTSKYFLWNPSTTEFKKLPRFDKPYEKYRIRSTICGFGYDHTIDDYKVIKIEHLYIMTSSSDDHLHNVSPSSIINIYKLGSNTWSTQIETDTTEISELQVLGSESGVLVNGALHWMMVSTLGLATILCFDIVKEKEHRVIKLPPFNSAAMQVMWRASRLQVLNGCLCIFLVDSIYENAELWLMMDYSTGSKSWTKLFTIDVRSLNKEITYGNKHRFEFTLKLLKYNSEDDGIIMLCDELFAGYEQPGFKYLITCYPKKEKATIENTCMEYYGKNAERCLEYYEKKAESYIESLVSVKSGMYLNKMLLKDQQKY